MKATFKLKADEGISKRETLAEWLDREYPAAPGTLREGIAKMFTINRLGRAKTVQHCVAESNVIECPGDPPHLHHWIR